MNEILAKISNGDFMDLSVFQNYGVIGHQNVKIDNVLYCLFY